MSHSAWIFLIAIIVDKNHCLKSLIKAQALKTYLSYGEQKGLKEKKVITASKVEKFAVQNWPFFWNSENLGTCNFMERWPALCDNPSRKVTVIDTSSKLHASIIPKIFTKYFERLLIGYKKSLTIVLWKGYHGYLALNLHPVCLSAEESGTSDKAFCY